MKKKISKEQKIILALKSGREISLYDSREFEIGEMHTAICYISRKIRYGQIPGWKMRDKWAKRGDVRYKVYWFEKDEK